MTERDRPERPEAESETPTLAGLPVEALPPDAPDTHMRLRTARPSRAPVSWTGLTTPTPSAARVR